ncbi:MAG: rod shape-determining protein MreC [Pseudomonadota bacterium]
MASVIALQPRGQFALLQDTAPVAPPSRAEALAQVLLTDAQVSPHAMVEALRLHRSRGGRFADILLARGLVAEAPLYQAMARVWQVGLLDRGALRPDARLIDRFGAVNCMALHLLPCRVLGGGTLVATAYPEDFHRPLRRVLVGLLVLALIGLFALWRIDSPRVERFRAALIDRFVPSMQWAMAPVTWTVGVMDNYQSYSRLLAQNQQLREELKQMRQWKEAALQLSQTNARLLDLNQVRLDPRLTHVTGVVLADSGSPFRQSVLLNVGARDGIIDGWATMDGVGLVGRISGVGAKTSRVILLTDSNSRVPVVVQPSGQKAILSGDNGDLPPLDFLEDQTEVRPGDQVFSSGDGGVFPSGLLIGSVVLGTDKRLRVALAADYQRLEFLRVLRSHSLETITDQGALLAPEPTELYGPPKPPTLGSAASQSSATRSGASHD